MAVGLSDDKAKALLMCVRQALIMIIGAIEDYLGMERSIVPKHRRRAVD